MQRAKVVHSDYHSLVKVSKRKVIAMTIFVPLFLGLLFKPD